MLQRLDDPLLLPLVPPSRRAAVALLWRLDARLGDMARSGKEPALRQIRLKWWEEQLASLTSGSRPPEPLLASIAAELLPLLDASSLAALAEGWGESVAEEGAATGQGAALFALTARLLDIRPGEVMFAAGEGWAAVDALLNEGAPADDPRWDAVALARLRLRALPRPLAALTGVARLVGRRRGVRSAGREQAAIFRIGLLGF